MSTKVIHINSIGEVIFNRRKGSSRISLRVKPDGTIRVSYPWYATQKEVLSFVLGSKDWIDKQKKKQENQQVRFKPGETFETKLHQIKIVSVEKGPLRAVRKNSDVVVTIPDDKDASDESVQLFIRKVIIEICRKEAKMYLPSRVQQLAQVHGLNFEKVFIKNLKSKWGSCSSNGNINLNLHLMLLPDHLIDYIILHELAHTVELNHSPAFWTLLDNFTQGMARKLDKEMKSYGRLILK